MNMFILWMATTAEATTMVPLSMDQMVDLSSTVVRGKVTNVWTEPDSNNRTRFGLMHKWKLKRSSKET